MNRRRDPRGACGRGASAELAYAAVLGAQPLEHSLTLGFHLFW